MSYQTAYMDIWNTVLDKIKKSNYFDEDTFIWIEKTNLFKVKEHTAYVTYRSAITKVVIEKSQKILNETLSEVWGNELKIQPISQKEADQMEPEVIVEQRTNTLLDVEFNPAYTFENFIEGSSNAEAYAACLSTCTRNSYPTFNPLMIYGNSGLGKTHLLHAIGNYLKKEKPEAKVIYMYSGNLVSLLIEAMKTKNIHGNTVERVKEQLLDCDYFLIDDIQNLQHSSSQEIFFTVYNELIKKRSQIVITSDIHPSELSGLQSRLVSRFSSGLSINISKPGFETSKAILMKKLEGREGEICIKDEVIDFLSQSFSNDVRNLEGSLNRLIFNATLFNPEVIDLEFAKSILEKEPIIDKSKELNIREIKKAVSRFYGLSYSDLEGKSRQKFIATARHICVYLSRELLHKSYQQIGLELGKRDHTTIASSYERACKLLKTDDAFKEAVKQIQEKLK